MGADKKQTHGLCAGDTIINRNVGQIFQTPISQDK